MQVKELNELIASEKKMLRMMCGGIFRYRISNLAYAEKVVLESTNECEVFLARTY